MARRSHCAAPPRNKQIHRMISGSSHIGCMCIFTRRKGAEIDGATAYLDAGAPSVFPAMNSLKATSVMTRTARIVQILGGRRFAEIAPAIVVGIAVDMIDIERREFSRDVEEGQPMGKVLGPINPNQPMAMT